MASEKIDQAVALGYAAGMPAPKVLAQGRGALAQAIVEKAEELGIPTRTEPALVEFLMALDVHAWVPPELYAAVAEVLAWAYEETQQEPPIGPAVSVAPAGPAATAVAEPIKPANS